MKLVLKIVALYAAINISSSGVFGASECGKIILNKDKINGKSSKTLEGQWPWEVAIYRLVPHHRYICGGTLVSDRLIITAAHCAVRKSQVADTDSFVVYLGQHNIMKFKEEIQVRAVKEIRIHPEYDMTTFNRDLAIFELHKPVTFSNWVQPACIWPDTDIELRNVVGQRGTKLFIYGDFHHHLPSLFPTILGSASSQTRFSWISVFYMERLPVGPPQPSNWVIRYPMLVGWLNDDHIDELELLEMPVVSQETCIRSSPAFYGRFTSDSTYCAKSEKARDGCIAGGHGMVFEKDDSWYLRGVVSLALAKPMDFTFTCDPTQYTIFADVAQTLPWIQENVKEY